MFDEKLKFTGPLDSSLAVSEQSGAEPLWSIPFTPEPPPAAPLCSLTAADFRVTPLPDYFTSAGRIKINRAEKKFFFQEAAQWARTMWGLCALPSGLLPLALTHIHFTLSSWRADQEALMRFNTEGSGTLFVDVHKFHT